MTVPALCPGEGDRGGRGQGQEGTGVGAGAAGPDPIPGVWSWHRGCAALPPLAAVWEVQGAVPTSPIPVGDPRVPPAPWEVQGAPQFL